MFLRKAEIIRKNFDVT